MLLRSFSAHAEEKKSYCVSPAALASQVKDCALNVYYVKAARSCVAKLEKEIETQQALLSAAMLLAQQNAADSQSSRIQNTVQDLSQMQSTLSGLEDEAKQARAELVAYSRTFTYAGPISPAFAERFHMTGFLQKFPCFADNMSLLGDEVKTIDHHIADLEKGAKAAAQLAGANGANLKKLDASSNTAEARGRATASVPPKAGRSGTPTNGASSITGTEKAGADDNALKLIEQKP